MQAVVTTCGLVAVAEVVAAYPQGASAVRVQEVQNLEVQMLQDQMVLADQVVPVQRAAWVVLVVLCRMRVVVLDFHLGSLELAATPVGLAVLACAVSGRGCTAWEADVLEDTYHQVGES